MSSRPFLPQLESLRGILAAGVLTTHVAFQTGIDPGTHVGAFLTRLDFFVAGFFALSGFLLWRGAAFEPKQYYSHRFWRIVPAYWVCVLVTLIFVPVAFRASPLTVVTTMTFSQMYVPNGYHGGLTHLWSLCVEVFFYLTLPGLWFLLHGLSPKQRITAIIGLAILSLGWAFLPLVNQQPSDNWPNMQIFPPAFFPWLAVGLIAAELERLKITCRWMRIRWPWWLAAGFLMWLAGRDFFGPIGLVHPEPHEFALRVIAGTATCLCLLWPYALYTGPSLLDAPAFRRLGEISYSLFLWHLPVLSCVFPLVGIRTFSGAFWVIWIATFVVSIVVATCSYELIERPFRNYRTAKQTLLSWL